MSEGYICIWVLKVGRQFSSRSFCRSLTWARKLELICNLEDYLYPVQYIYEVI